MDQTSDCMTLNNVCVLSTQNGRVPARVEGMVPRAPLHPALFRAMAHQTTLAELVMEMSHWWRLSRVPGEESSTVEAWDGHDYETWRDYLAFDLTDGNGNIIFS